MLVDSLKDTLIDSDSLALTLKDSDTLARSLAASFSNTSLSDSDRLSDFTVLRD